MLRPTSTKLMLPLPLYKIGIVLVRQLTRPLAQTLLEKVEQYPVARHNLIRVGWWHFRVSTHANRLVWGIEQQQEAKAKEKEAEHHQPIVEDPPSSSSSKTATSTSKDDSSSVPTTFIPKREDAALAAATSFSIGGAKPTTTAKAELSQEAMSEGIASIATTKILKPKTASVETEEKPRTFASPRTLKILPRALNPLIQVENVRKIFVAPPRPTDEELLGKGMTLTLEFLVLLFFSLILSYELHSAKESKRAEDEALDARFKALESFVVLQKQLNGQQQQREQQQQQQDSSPKDSTASVAVPAEKETPQQQQQQQEQQQQVATTQTPQQPPEQQQEIQTPLAPPPPAAAIAVVAAPSTSINSVRDLWSTWLTLPLDVRTFIFCFVAAPYISIFALFAVVLGRPSVSRSSA